MSRRIIERQWHACPRCGLAVVTRKLHGRPLRKWHAACWTVHRSGTAPVVGDLSAVEIERRIGEAERAQRATWRDIR